MCSKWSQLFDEHHGNLQLMLRDKGGGLRALHDLSLITSNLRGRTSSPAGPTILMEHSAICVADCDRKSLARRSKLCNCVARIGS